MTGSVRCVLTAVTIALAAVGCRSADPAAPGPATLTPLFGAAWVVEAVDGRALDGDGAGVRWTSAVTTGRTCAGALMDRERRFLAALGDVARYPWSVDRLLLLEPAGRVKVVPAPATGGRGAAAEPEPSADATLGLHGRPHVCREDRERSITEDARFRGVEFRAIGHEPGWTLEVRAERLEFLGGYEAGAVTTPRPASRLAPATGETVYTAATEAHRIVVHVRETRCLDAVSGTRFEASVEVELNGTAYRGCGQRLR